MNNKKIALISTFCDTQEKIDILLENVRKIKQLGIDVMAIGPNNLVMPDEVIDECDFFFYTKENPILTYPVRQYTHWFSMPLENGLMTTFHRGFSDYGWAALYQTKKLSELALTFDYDVYCHIIYDLEITEEVEKRFLSDDINVLHPRIDPHDPNRIWETTLHFMILDREATRNIANEIDLDLYLNMNCIAEDHVNLWKNKYSLKISDLHVKDKIFYWTGHNFFDYAIHKDFKFFISKNPETEIWLGLEEPFSEILPDTLRMVFYDFVKETPNEMTVIVNDKVFVINPSEWNIQELPVSSQEVETIKIVYQGKPIDITDLYRKISFNQIYYNRHFKN